MSIAGSVNETDSSITNAVNDAYLTGVHKRIKQVIKSIEDAQATVKNDKGYPETKISQDFPYKHQLQSLELVLKHYCEQKHDREYSIYLMEGATRDGGSLQSPLNKPFQGRQSTDPDENMALQVIWILTYVYHKHTIVAVPDISNRARTKNFLERLGATAEELTKSGELKLELKPGIVYIVSMQDEPTMSWLGVHTSGKHRRRIFLLGPPLGHCHELLKTDVALFNDCLEPEVLFMGNAELTRHDAGEYTMTKRSTNLRDKDNDDAKPVEKFVKLVVKHFLYQIIPSSSMAAFKLNISHLLHWTSCIIDADVKHWAKNTCEQIRGFAPRHLLYRRLRDSGAIYTLYKCVTSDKGKESPFDKLLDEKAVVPQAGVDKTDTEIHAKTPYIFLEFLTIASQADLAHQDYPLSKAVTTLGPNYKFLNERGSRLATEYLREISLTKLEGDHITPEAIIRDPDGTNYHISFEEREKVSELIYDMGAPQKNHAFAAFALALHHIYEEKTRGGWTAVPEHKQPDPNKNNDKVWQWNHKTFAEIYKLHGVQIPYDALVVFQPLYPMFEPCRFTVHKYHREGGGVKYIEAPKLATAEEVEKMAKENEIRAKPALELLLLLLMADIRV